MKTSLRLALVCLLLTRLLQVNAWAMPSPPTLPDANGSPVPEASPLHPTGSPSEEEGPNLSDLLRLTPEQASQVQAINLRVSERLMAEKDAFRQRVIAVLTAAQRTRLRQLLEAHAHEAPPDFDLKAALRLTPGQVTRLRQLQEGQQARLDALWTSYLAAIKDVLTPAQAAVLDEYLRQQATAP